MTRQDSAVPTSVEATPPDGRLVTQMRTRELHEFLSRTLAVVPLGAETVDLDLLVESLVGQSESQ